MKIPKSIRISGHDIKVVRKKNISLDGTPCMGLSYLAQSKIEIATHIFEEKIPESRIRETLLHEIVHFIASIHVIKLSEKEVNEIALGIYQTITDNKLKF